MLFLKCCSCRSKNGIVYVKLHKIHLRMKPQASITGSSLYSCAAVGRIQNVKMLRIGWWCEMISRIKQYHQTITSLLFNSNCAVVNKYVKETAFHFFNGLINWKVHLQNKTFWNSCQVFTLTDGCFRSIHPRLSLLDSIIPYVIRLCLVRMGC